MAITLYGGPQTRASMPRWYMEEKGIPYDLVELSLAEGQNLKEDFLAINPFGKLPAMKDDSVLDSNGHPLVLFESGAILLHLAEHHGDEIKQPGDRSLISQWTHFANSTLAFAIFVPDQKQKILPRLLSELDSKITKGYFINNKWGAADCAITSYLAYIKLFFPNEDLSAYPAVNILIQATRERPAYQKVMGFT
ncbi:glutathione S-transferase [Synechococcus sp. MU1655]|uniref:glutathione S-transferase family protein n=1 Tax=Synechococcus sp. MU1655 TaxID=2508355 RepID=UPI0020267576